MDVKATDFKDLYLLEYNSIKDKRGEFVKTIHKETFIKHNLEFEFSECFYSVSHKNVFRGMHFQYWPYEHDKLVYVTKGAIIDVVLDLRADSETFGKHFTVELNDENRKGVYIGKGFGHGFLSLQDDTMVEYHVTTMQDKESEGGIRWDSFGFESYVNKPIISERDEAFQAFDFNKRYF